MISLLLPIQIILGLFLIFALSRVILHLRDGGLSLGAFLFWLALWTLAIISVLRPDFTSFLAGKIGIGRGADAVIYISIAILFYLVFRINVILENLRQEITKLTREFALKEKEKK